MELPQDLQGWLILVARIALPIVVFFITFGPKIDAWLSSWGPHYSRDEMLRHWKVTQGCERPSVFSSLNLVTAETAPSLFQKPEPPERARPKAKPKAREGRDRPDKERPGDRAEKADVDKPSVSEDAPAGRPFKTQQEQSSRKSSADKDVASEEDRTALRRMHFESLVNFVAFNHRQPQRVFLPTGDPPPPPARKAPAEAELSGKDVLQANREAQMVLHGALEMDATGPNQVLGSVARSLSDQLSAASVDILSETYGLMVRACIKVVDLPACSDFLVRMEAAGLALDGDLLDQVMELYWSQKKQSQEPAKNEPLSILPKHLRGAAEQYQPRQDAATSSSAAPGSLQGMQQTIEQLSQSSDMQGPLAGMQHLPLTAPPGALGQMPLPSFAHNPVPVMGPGLMPSGVEPFNASSHLAPGGWNATGLSTSVPRKRTANGDAGRRVNPDLPAFSVPEEFASKVPADAATSTLSSDAPEFQPDAGASELFEQMLALAKQGSEGDMAKSSGLSPEAHEFRPGQLAAAVRDVSSAHAKGTKISNKYSAKPAKGTAESSVEPKARPHEPCKFGADDVAETTGLDRDRVALQ